MAAHPPARKNTRVESGCEPKASHSDGPLACGLLQVHPGSGLFASWKVRWCDMRHGVLTYRKRPEVKESERAFNLASVSAVKPVAGVPKGSKKKYAECGFSIEGIATGGEQFVLIAETTAERRRWLERVTAAVEWARTVHPKPPVPAAVVIPPVAVLTDAKGWAPLPPTGDAAAAFVPALENPEDGLAWYRKYFAVREHAVFAATNDKVERAPVLVAVKRCELDLGTPMIRGLIIAGGFQRRLLVVPTEPFRSYAEDLGAVLAAHDTKAFKQRKHFKNVSSNAVRDTMLRLEDMQFARKHKIGVLYARQGQVEEGPMFSNDIDSPTGADAPFAQFLGLLGTSIELQGWDGYRAGLDVEAGGTGTHSVFTTHHGLDVMFHVSSLLPHDRENSGQEVQRKRQIGNDICAIVFVNGVTPYSPATVKCQFLHCYAVVQPDPEPGFYRVQFARQACMSGFGAPYAFDRVPATAAAIDFLLTKLINGERTALASAPDFRLKQKRTDDVVIQQLVEGLGKGTDGAVVTALPGPLPVVRGSGDTGPRRAAIRDAPFGTEVFGLRPVAEGLPAGVLSWDHWADKSVYSTAAGLFISDGDEPIQVCNIAMAQVAVLEDIGVIVALGKVSSLVSIIYLSSIGEWSVVVLGASKHCSSFKVRRADGDIGLCLIVRKQLQFYTWADAGFHQDRKSLELASPPVFVDYAPDGRLLVVDSSAAYFLNAGTGEVQALNTPPRSRLQSGGIFLPQGRLDDPVVVSLDYEGATLTAGGTKVSVPAVQLPWSFLPEQLFFVDPYVVAVRADMIEVRSSVNGALVQTLRPSPPVALLSMRQGLFLCMGGDRAGTTTIAQFLPTDCGIYSTASAVATARAAAPVSVRDRLAAKGGGGRRASVAALRDNRASVHMSVLAGLPEVLEVPMEDDEDGAAAAGPPAPEAELLHVSATAIDVRVTGPGSDDTSDST